MYMCAGDLGGRNECQTWSKHNGRAVGFESLCCRPTLTNVVTSGSGSRLVDPETDPDLFEWGWIPSICRAAPGSPRRTEQAALSTEAGRMPREVGDEEGEEGEESTSSRV